jgi:type II secretory pathway component PulF
VKRLSFLIKAGIPARESLVMIREQTERKGYASILDSVIANISNGQNLSRSLAKFPSTFGDFAVNIIGFGEQSGILSENLEYVADELEKKHALKKKIISASIYPIIVTLSTIGITAFLIIYLFPKILPIFKSISADLPFSTRIVITVSGFMINYGLLCIGVLIFLAITLLATVKKNGKTHFYFGKFILKMPILKKIIKDYNLANFTRTLGLLLKSGMSLSEALPISARITSNLAYKKEFQALAIVVDEGGKISTQLSKNRQLFPNIATQIIAVGEQSGNLSNSLIYLSTMYEAELDDVTKNLSSLVEPVLMIIMGLLVGFIAISIITPIYGITQHLQPK